MKPLYIHFIVKLMAQANFFKRVFIYIYHRNPVTDELFCVYPTYWYREITLR